ncbi:MAG TPA: response regulator, partial [Myxococcaceae bacterium]|nr:response regulator [Myxococcaceae bacterium]
MSKQILIVEGDAALSNNVRSALESKGFAVEETSDGKGSIELVRRLKPELVLLAVELPAGQNGYILCGKLKKDDELKGIPVVIIGNPDGFAQHRKLKTRADEYVAKPLELDAVVETVGALIGFPEVAQAEEVIDESLSLSDLVDDTGPHEVVAEEIAVETEATVNGDPELDMLDAAFDDMSDPQGAPEQAAAAPEDDEPLVTATQEEDDAEPVVAEEVVEETL